MTHGGSQTPWAIGMHNFLFAHRHPSRRSAVVAFPDARGHGLSISRELLNRMGGYEPDMRIGEDTQLYERLSRLGVPVVFNNRIRCEHLGHWTPWGTLRDAFIRGRRRGQLETNVLHECIRKDSVGSLYSRAARGAWNAIRDTWPNSLLGRVLAVAASPWTALASTSYHLAWAVTRITLIPTADYHRMRDEQSLLSVLHENRATEERQLSDAATRAWLEVPTRDARTPFDSASQGHIPCTLHVEPPFGAS